MEFSQDNEVVKLCVDGMVKEGQGKMNEAELLFMRAWDLADSDFEKFTAAHYLARHQKEVGDKLKWDELSLRFALKIEDEGIKSTLPSLYLNIGKCNEDLGYISKARESYEKAESFIQFLPKDEYGSMIEMGIKRGLERIKNS